MYELVIGFDEILCAILLFLWVIAVVRVISKKAYDFMISKGFRHNVAVYYNRKIIHIAAGGLVALLVPYVFKTPMLPLMFASLLAIFTYIPHRRNKLMFWFQTPDNIYEVHFCIMWGLIIMLGWVISEGNFWFGVLPVLFMALGDAITGLVRNTIYKKRTKSWWGNLAMASLSIPLGAVLGIAGMVAGAIASIVEHFEIGPIDDNILVPLTSFTILTLTLIYAPWLLSLEI